MITKVTITGADDSINPKKLLELSEKYPFVEWGILVSKKHFGSYRFPTIDWLKKLGDFWNGTWMGLSCHLCGYYVRELVTGNNIARDELGYLWHMFDRVQINFHAEVHQFGYEMFDAIKINNTKEFIFQYDSVNDFIVKKAKENGVDNCSVLFDTSGGAGVLPGNWQKPLDWVKCGYAGGISPENIESQILLINSIVGETETWIDMETHVRSNNDSLFDLNKVEKCLEISSKYIK